MAMFGRHIKDCVPPVLWRALRRFGGHVAAFKGNYASWEEARAHSTGYNSAEIFQRVLSSTLTVKAGLACFERDSVLFHHPEPRYPLLVELLSNALANEGHLAVIDVGGALGSLYFQHRSFFAKMATVQWNVVEQDEFVALGRAHVANDQLRFYESIEACCVESNPIMGVASSVLQYVSDPRSLLLSLLGVTQTAVIDRLPLIPANSDRLTVQNVPSTIYCASYPAWFFSRQRFMDFLAANRFRAVREFSSIDVLELDGKAVQTTGLVIERDE